MRLTAWCGEHPHPGPLPQGDGVDSASRAWRRLGVVLIAVVVALLPAAGLAAGPALAPEALRGLLEQANEKFRQATRVAPEDPAAAKLLYQESIVRFEKIVSAGNVRNGKLFYNLANAYLLQGDVGRSILNYRRAERLTPEDRNLQGNLAFARNQVRDSIPVPPQRRVLDTVLAWHNGLPVLPRLAVFVIAFDLIWLLAALKLLNLARFSLRLPVAMLAVVAALCLGSLVVDEVDSRRANEGVIVAAQVVGRKGPDPVGYAPSFRAPLHAGVEFGIVEERPGWYLVRLRDDRETWLPVSAVERV